MLILHDTPTVDLRMTRWLQNMCGETVLEMYYKIFDHFKCVNISVFVHTPYSLINLFLRWHVSYPFIISHIANNVQKLVP